MNAQRHVVPHAGTVTVKDRNRLNGHRSLTVWFTGLPASGKSTIAHALEEKLYDRGIRTYVLDGDNVRRGLNSDLGFSREDRQENIRRISEISWLLMDAGVVVLCAFISPFEEDRRCVRERLGGDRYLEVYVRCSLETCESRDPKDQYKKARAGLIKNYTGVSTPYEEPRNPDLTIDTEEVSVHGAVSSLLSVMSERHFLRLENESDRPLE